MRLLERNNDWSKKAMPKFIRPLFIGGMVAAVVVLAGPGGMRVSAAQVKPARLDTVLRQMDAASTKFQSAQANLRKEVFTKVVNDTEEQTGLIYFARKGGSTQMGMKMTSQPQQVVEYKDGRIRVYNPGTNHVDEVSASGTNKTRFETFLTLGFGGSGKDLEKAWTIEDQGTESMSDGEKTVATEKLDLVSKDPDTLKTVSHVVIWVDPARAVTLKQLFYFPKGDTQTASYTNIRLNQTVDMSQFAIKCKGKCS
jgi:outer membrane lipoprotein-sorting protein